MLDVDFSPCAIFARACFTVGVVGVVSLAGVDITSLALTRRVIFFDVDETAENSVQRSETQL